MCCLETTSSSTTAADTKVELIMREAARDASSTRLRSATCAVLLLNLIYRFVFVGQIYIIYYIYSTYLSSKNSGH